MDNEAQFGSIIFKRIFSFIDYILLKIQLKIQHYRQKSNNDHFFFLAQNFFFSVFTIKGVNIYGNVVFATDSGLRGLGSSLCRVITVCPLERKYCNRCRNKYPSLAIPTLVNSCQLSSIPHHKFHHLQNSRQDSESCRWQFSSKNR